MRTARMFVLEVHHHTYLMYVCISDNIESVNTYHHSVIKIMSLQCTCNSHVRKLFWLIYIIPLCFSRYWKLRRGHAFDIKPRQWFNFSQATVCVFPSTNFIHSILVSAAWLSADSAITHSFLSHLKISLLLLITVRQLLLLIS